MEIVSFVILHYKDADVTDTCVQSVLRMDQQERIRIVIVDNDLHESPEHRRLLRDRYAGVSNIYVIQIEENGGFSYANNKGYAFARETLKASFVVAANNDIEFDQKDFLQRLDDVYREHSCHVLGPDIVRRRTGEHQNPMDTRLRTRKEAEYTIRMNKFALKLYCFLYPVLYLNNKISQRLILRKSIKEEFYADKQTNIIPCGACLLFTPDFVKKEEKAFDPETEFYYEEYILALRCKKKNYRIVYDPSLIVWHEGVDAVKKSYNTERKRLKFMMKCVADSCEVYKKYLTDK